jgi:glutathione peroxidase
MILAFPSNEFKGQESYSNGAIAEFCKKNYGVTFPLFGKAKVKKGVDQHVVYQWLTDSTRNGWNSQAPAWNFSKFLISDEGQLLGYFGPSVSPEVIAERFLN